MKRRAHVFLGMSLAAFCCAGCASPTLISFDDIDGNSAELRASTSSEDGSRPFRLAAGDALGQEIFADYVVMVKASQPQRFEYATDESDYDEPASEPFEFATAQSDDDPSEESDELASGESDDDLSGEPAEVVTGESDLSDDDPTP